MVPCRYRTTPASGSVGVVHFVIMGCGRVGASLAGQLEDHGHSVAVVDQNPDAFRRLPASFEGRRVTGLGFDRDALAQAGIDDAFAFAAVSNGDNSNIIAARVVRETFGVRNVVARIYDPNRAEVYQRLGIPTVATVRWTADQVLRRILPLGAVSEYQDASSKVSIITCDVHAAWVGQELDRLEQLTAARVAYLTRLGQGIVPQPGTVVQENDLVHLAVPTDRIGPVQRVLAAAPARED
jgi:trk system potassium uptake protein